MSTATKNLITATAAIVKMSGDDRETLLLTILESNPAAVLAAMKLNGVSFGEDTKPCWRVVVENKGINKIHLIKMFREETGAGLADAKYWSEGNTYNCGAMSREGGVIHDGLTKTEAEIKAEQIRNRSGQDGNFTVKVIKSTDHYHYDSNWGNGWTA